MCAFLVGVELQRRLGLGRCFLASAGGFEDFRESGTLVGAAIAEPESRPLQQSGKIIEQSMA